MKRLLFSILFFSVWASGICQDIMTVLPDSGIDNSQEFICVKAYARDFGLSTLNQDLNFTYFSQNTGYKMSHDMNLTGITNIPNIGAGIDETYGHLLINFIDGSAGYYNHVWNWNLGAGIGYSTSLSRKNNFMFRAYLNFFYQNISYGLGSYSDTTLQGFVINGANIGTYIKNVKYVNNLFCASPMIEFLYRANKWDFFIGGGYDYTIYYSERLNFYRTHISIPNGLYYPSGNAVYKGAVLPGHYIIQLGIIKEFEL